MKIEKVNKFKIAELIEHELGHTNGWRISDEDYKKHCEDVAQQIIECVESQPINNSAKQIHFELAIKAGQICKKYPNQIIKEIPEYNEVKRLWDTMDIIEQYYL